MAPTPKSKPPIGRVYLVGAGPGAPGLLTLRARALLGVADVVVYDALVNPAILRYARPDAERIDAGKRAGKHRLAQDETNALLVQRALEGKTVVRLKGGDPFLFGRGGEEAATCKAAAVPYEIIPGISSAFAVPAYAGISLTKRNVSSSVHIFTAQGADSTAGMADWGLAAQLGGTLVFLMGFGRIGEISRNLIDNGMTPDRPVAVIQWGTTVHQRQVFTTLSEAPQAAEAAGLGPPAVVVIGEVADDVERFDWTNSLPLFGRTIGFTRDARRALPWLEAFEGLGARVMDFALVHSHAIGDSPDTKTVLDQLDSFDWIVFSNTLGVEAFFDLLNRHGLDARSLAGRRIAAIGPSTADTLLQRGVRADLVPAIMTQEGLARELPIETGTKVLLPGSPLSRRTLLRAIESQNGTAVRLHLYDSHARPQQRQALWKSIEAGELDSLVVMAPRAAEILVAESSAEDLVRLLAPVRVVCLGALSARVMETAGRPADRVLEKPTREALVDALTLADDKG